MSTPILRMIALAASRSSWYWPSVRVRAGATVTLSPVCTPMGSTFSMEQMITTLSARSRMTSSSNSCQPATDSSSITWVMGLRRRPLLGDAPQAVAVVGDAAAGAAQGEGRAHDERQAEIAGGALGVGQRGRRSRCAARAGRSPPWRCGTRRRSSARRMASASAPIISTSQRSRMPLSLSSIARFRAVWPPSVGSSASGRSISMMRVSVGRSSGSM